MKKYTIMRKGSKKQTKKEQIISQETNTVIEGNTPQVDVKPFVFDKNIRFKEQIKNFEVVGDDIELLPVPDSLYLKIGEYPSVIIGDNRYLYRFMDVDIGYRFLVSDQKFIPTRFPAIIDARNRLLYHYTHLEFQYYQKIISAIYNLKNVEYVELWGSGLFFIPFIFERIYVLPVKFIVYEPSSKMYEVAKTLLQKLKLENTTLLKDTVSTTGYPRFLVYKEAVYEDKTFW